MKTIHQCDIPDKVSASDTKLKDLQTITLHLSMGESRTCVNFGAVNSLFVSVFLRTTHIDRFIKSIHLAERNIFPHHSPPVPTIKIRKARSEVEHNHTEAR